MEFTQAHKADLTAVLAAIVSTVKEAGPEGAPNGPMYLAFMEAGGSIDQWNRIIEVLCERKILRQSNHVLYYGA